MSQRGQAKGLWRKEHPAPNRGRGLGGAGLETLFFPAGDQEGSRQLPLGGLEKEKRAKGDGGRGGLRGGGAMGRGMGGGWLEPLALWL